MSTQSDRLDPQPKEVIDRTRPIRFTWRGTDYMGFAGDTIASALAANGVSTFSRSLKYRRRRGIITANGYDPGLLVTVDREPNVRAGHRLVRAGMAVEPQNVWPSLDFDVRSATNLVSPALAPGFYYKTFMRPVWAVPTYQRVIRRFSPGGAVDIASAGWRAFSENRAVDVLVVGGGPAGMAAALAACDGGASVVLVEEHRWLGGHLAASSNHPDLDFLARAVRERSSVEVMLDSVALGRFDGNLVPVVRRAEDGREHIVRFRPRVLVVASGMVERPYVFAGNDLPGVMLGSAVRSLINLYGVRPGSTAVVLGATADGIEASVDLGRAGVQVAAVVDGAQGGGIVRASGRRRVEAVKLGDGRTLDADLVVVSAGHTAVTNLLTMAGGRHRFHPENSRFSVDGLPDDVLAAGHVTGDGTVSELVDHGSAVGSEAASRVRSPDHPARGVPPLRPRSAPSLFRSTTHGFVDLCEDVTSKDVLLAVGEGFANIETAKRFTTASMGPTQGRLEVVNLSAVIAEVAGHGVGEVGITTWRPPFVPTTLGALAGGRMEPVRISPMQDWHDSKGAVPMQAGAWIRPDHYGDPPAEAANVRIGVGIIDVSPLGKFELRGPGVPALLEFLYVNRWSHLGVGRVRYGLMCADDGVIIDDGVTGRLDEDRYLMTTTSSGADWMGEWIDDILTMDRFDSLYFEQVTDAYASINVAGPLSRQLMQRVAPEIDFSAGSFPYMTVRTGTVAGVSDVVLWRIGFTGELSYEIHIPAGAGLHVWERLLEFGADLDVAPFGVEAQRILRLEKGHVIVSQDTDGLTGPHEIGMSGLVKLDKTDFMGKLELTWRLEEPAPLTLVALRPEGDTVPEEASLIVDGREIVGRITSSRWSPALDAPICLGFVSQSRAVPGRAVTVVLPSGERIRAIVQEHHAQFDPDGARLHV